MSGGGLSASGATSVTSGGFSSAMLISSCRRINRNFMQTWPPWAGRDVFACSERGPSLSAWPALALCSLWLAFWLSPLRPSSCCLRLRPWPCSQTVPSAFQHPCSLPMMDRLWVRCQGNVCLTLVCEEHTGLKGLCLLIGRGRGVHVWETSCALEENCRIFNPDLYFCARHGEMSALPWKANAPPVANYANAI